MRCRCGPPPVAPRRLAHCGAAAAGRRCGGSSAGAALQQQRPGRAGGGQPHSRERRRNRLGNGTADHPAAGGNVQEHLRQLPYCLRAPCLDICTMAAPYQICQSSFAATVTNTGMHRLSIYKAAHMLSLRVLAVSELRGDLAPPGWQVRHGNVYMHGSVQASRACLSESQGRAP